MVLSSWKISSCRPLVPATENLRSFVSMEEKALTPDAAASAAPVSAPAAAAPAPAPAPEAAADERIDIDHFMKVKLRVARIEAAEPVPKSNKLMKLQLDVGPLGKRQILAGIAKFYTPESLIGRRIVIVANLQPA